MVHAYDVQPCHSSSVRVLSSIASSWMDKRDLPSSNLCWFWLMMPCSFGNLIMLSLVIGVRLAMVTVIFSSSFLRLFFPHLSLTAFSITSPQLLLSSCCCSPISCRSFQIFLNVVFPPHSRSASPPFPSTFWASALFSNF